MQKIPEFDRQILNVKGAKVIYVALFTVRLTFCSTVALSC